MDKNISERVLELAKEKKALLFGSFDLSAGGKSPFYFDGRLLTLDPEGSYYIAKGMLALAYKVGANAIAGPTIGADPIVASVIFSSFMEKRPISGLLVRKDQKAHGGKKQIEGTLYEGMNVMVVDDTCTTARSLFMAIEAIENQGCTVVQVASILDRNEGGSNEIKKRGYKFFSFLTANEKGEIWPSSYSDLSEL